MRRAVKGLVTPAICLLFTSTVAVGSPIEIAGFRPSNAGGAFSAPAGFVCSGGLAGGSRDVGPKVTDVRVGHHGDYDRFVIQFSGAAMPRYRVTHHSTTFPTEMGTVTLKGTHGVFVRLFPVNSSSYHGPTRIRPRFPLLKEARMVEYFEGHMNWGLGIHGKPCLRVAVFKSPIRLIVDVALP